MRIVTNLEELNIKEKTAVAIGYFDGFHIGHRKVIESVLEYKKKGYKICLFSFSITNNQPKNKTKDLITTFDDKIQLSKKIGIDYFISPSFDDIKNISPFNFLENIIKDKLSAQVIACGKDFRFGKKAEGNIEFLKLFSKKNNISLNIIHPVRNNDEIVSSTRIRELLLEGDIEKANRFLGRPYSYKLMVNRGRKIGRTLNFPTINQRFEKDQLMPRFGVYTGVVEIEEKLYPGAVNIGIIPTIKVETPVSETHIVGFSGDLYDKKVRVGLIEFLRPERRFDSKETLQKQIISDTKIITKKYEIWKKKEKINSIEIFY